MIESFVVVEKGVRYTGGNGYTGRALRELGFPEGPYIKKSAEILVRQARTLSTKVELVILPYRE